MLHYYGDITAMELAEEAKFYLPLYETEGKDFVLIPFQDLKEGRKRFVRFERMAGVDGWIFIELEG